MSYMSCRIFSLRCGALGARGRRSRASGCLGDAVPVRLDACRRRSSALDIYGLYPVGRQGEPELGLVWPVWACVLLGQRGGQCECLISVQRPGGLPRCIRSEYPGHDRRAEPSRVRRAEQAFPLGAVDVVLADGHLLLGQFLVAAPHLVHGLVDRLLLDVQHAGVPK